MFRTFITLKACKQRKSTKQNGNTNFIDLEEESKNNNIQEGNLVK